MTFDLHHIHSGPRVHLAGECAWTHTSDGARLSCDQRALPGGSECADHLIQRVHTQPGSTQP